ncbi:MAG: response regulator [Desulfobacter sp.]|nr:MAG: response regulator [Desulfobacter sp.]
MEQGTETILFVDDEDYLVEIGKEMLEDYGYTVETQTRPEDALSLFKQNPRQYDLLITDYTMPVMNGAVLAKEIRSVRPDIPVILCSGTRLSPEIESEVSKILLKPFDMDLLLSAVRETLDAAG